MMEHTKLISCSRFFFWLVLVYLWTTCSLPLFGQITFETVPGERVFEGKVITNQFLASDGVTFRFEDGSDAVLARIGPPAYGVLRPP